MYNRAILMGRICNNLVLKQTPAGVTVLQFRIAVGRSYAAKGEERQTDFFHIVAWRGMAEFIAKHFSKGRMIIVDGELRTSQYKDKNGSNQTLVELIVDRANFTGEAKVKGSTEELPPPPEEYADDEYPF